MNTQHIQTDQRENDIQEICRQVLDADPNVFNNPNGPDDTTCPLCKKITTNAIWEMDAIKHEANCAYLIAKDISTRVT